MKIEPGMRVRCITGSPDSNLQAGANYTVVDAWLPGFVILNEIPNMGWVAERFKPIVRVKAPCVPTLDLLIKRSVAAVNRMSPEDQTAMWKAQRESWARSCTGSGAD